MGKNQPWSALIPASLLLGLVALGCDNPPAGTPDRATVIPPADEAREALRRALEDWKAGNPKGTIGRGEGSIGVVDSLRAPGRALRSYEIKGPLASDQGRCFAVRLELKGPDEGRDERYLVFGWAPLWVFRMQDYELISHWEHAMDPVPEEDPAPQPPPAQHGPGGHPAAEEP